MRHGSSRALAPRLTDLVRDLDVCTATPSPSPAELHLVGVDVPGDGSCFWHSLVRCGAVDLGLWTDAEEFARLAARLREETWKELGGEGGELRARYRAFVQEAEDGDPTTYLSRLRRGEVWAGELEIEATTRVARSAIMIFDAVAAEAAAPQWQALLYGKAFLADRLLFLQRRGRHFTPLFPSAL